MSRSHTFDVNLTLNKKIRNYIQLISLKIGTVDISTGALLYGSINNLAKAKLIHLLRHL